MEEPDAKIRGWRLDALHMYGRGAYRDEAKRLVYSTTLWDELATFFSQHGLFAIVEQLGADGFAFEHFKKLGFIQYAFILDLKPKELRPLVDDLSGISRGIAFTVVDTHDSQRWAREYFGMFQYLAGLGLPEGDPLSGEKVLECCGPAFLGLLSLAPRMETVLLSLGEFATQDNIKQEFRDEGGIVNLTAWGTKEKGKHDFSAQIRGLVQIRRENPAVSHSDMILLSVNDPHYLVAFAKTYQDNHLICLANFSSASRTAKLDVPRDRFGLNGIARMVFQDLTNGKTVRVKGTRQLEYTLGPGQFAVLRLQQVETRRAQKKPAGGESTTIGHQEKLEWDWDNKHREVLLPGNTALVMGNDHVFSVSCLAVGNAEASEEVFTARWDPAAGRYEVRISGLEPGGYRMQIYWGIAGVSLEHAEREREVYYLRVLGDPALLLESGDPRSLSLRLSKTEIENCWYSHNTITLSNGIGSILRMPIRGLRRNAGYNEMETLGYTTKYDGFQGNLLLRVPDEQRRVLFRGATEVVRIITEGASAEYNLDLASLDYFETYPCPQWSYLLEFPGMRVRVNKTVVLQQGTNAFAFNYQVVEATGEIKSIDIFIRPELDQRLHHETTKAGGFNHWNSRHEIIQRQGANRGFVLHAINDQWRQWYPGFEGVAMTITQGEYSFAPEWRFGFNPIEGERGQDSCSDSYSPGFFHASLDCGGSTSVVFLSVDCHYLRLEPSKWYSRHAPYQVYVNGLGEGDYEMQFFWPRANRLEDRTYPLAIRGSGDSYILPWNWEQKSNGAQMTANGNLLVASAEPFYLTVKNRSNQESRFFSITGGVQGILDQSAPLPEEPEIIRALEEAGNLQCERLALIPDEVLRNNRFAQQLALGMWQFVARRDDFYTLIAGYPWFSDWGRDTFECFEGLLEAGMFEVAEGLLAAFGKFEKQGMLPNIVTGETASNYDTVDAPLLYCLSVRDYIAARGNAAILDKDVGGRNILAVVESIVRHYQNGTPNGI
ncbi:MAG: amylo-alpha-1,6-glucosidase, partial [Candidatus Omnitrophica bacterium]|nr:amylo-alpha-1,6-glucosidase [Candidatus Omnitrophota bacterium]